jgi:CysZ protein
MNPSLGIRAFADGFTISRHPALRSYVWLPVLVSFAIIALGLYLGLGYLTGLSDELIAALPEWLGWLDMLLTPLIYLLGVLIGAWTFAFLAVLISSPFLGAFSAALERIRYGSSPIADTGLWTDISKSISRELRKLIYHLPRLVVVFLITLIPVVNLASPVIWLLFGAWTMAVQFVDYPTENRQEPFQATLERLHANRGAALAFGICATGALMIPLLNFLLIPVAVAGGTLLWRYLDDDGSPAPADSETG